ncbi:hypothetical protein QCA50_014449 [Cerrena zonata]|uniref:Uncharacterized protein n=1 Tax=Cerrena zonata TaxID=2478898 RepID=A0AAW0FSX3_9APHY
MHCFRMYIAHMLLVIFFRRNISLSGIQTVRSVSHFTLPIYTISCIDQLLHQFFSLLAGPTPHSLVPLFVSTRLSFNEIYALVASILYIIVSLSSSCLFLTSQPSFFIFQSLVPSFSLSHLQCCTNIYESYSKSPFLLISGHRHKYT